MPVKMPVSVYYKCAVYLWSFGFSMDLLVLFRSLVEYNVTLISHISCGAVLSSQWLFRKHFFFFLPDFITLRDYLFLNDLIVVKQDTVIVKGKVDEQGIS